MFSWRSKAIQLTEIIFAIKLSGSTSDEKSQFLFPLQTKFSTSTWTWRASLHHYSMSTEILSKFFSIPWSSKHFFLHFSPFDTKHHTYTSSLVQVLLKFIYVLFSALLFTGKVGARRMETGFSIWPQASSRNCPFPVKPHIVSVSCNLPNGGRFIGSYFQQLFISWYTLCGHPSGRDSNFMQRILSQTCNRLLQVSRGSLLFS